MTDARPLGEGGAAGAPSAPRDAPSRASGPVRPAQAVGPVPPARAVGPVRPAQAVHPAPPVVVVAASAGGIDALAAVLGPLPRSFGAAVVVVQHLDPGRPTALPAVLGRRVAMPVRLADDGDALRPGVVLVAPPDRHIRLRPDGTVALSREPRVNFVRPSADLLFASAAASHGDRVIAVVLTGTGHDASGGALAVHEHGGAVLAQDPVTAAFAGMPAAAIATGCVDAVLALGEIGPAIAALAAERS